MWGNEIGASGFQISGLRNRAELCRVLRLRLALRLDGLRRRLTRGEGTSVLLWTSVVVVLRILYPIIWASSIRWGPEPLGSGCLDRPMQSKNLGRVNLPNCTGIGGS